jgi:hypothetical protein
MWEILIFKWFLPLKSQINSKNQVLEGKINWKHGNTWANATRHTNMFLCFDLVYKFKFTYLVTSDLFLYFNYLYNVFISKCQNITLIWIFWLEKWRLYKSRNPFLELHNKVLLYQKNLKSKVPFKIKNRTNTNLVKFCCTIIVEGVGISVFFNEFCDLAKVVIIYKKMYQSGDHSNKTAT